MLAVFFISCKDENKTETEFTTYDPSKPVEITGFIPKAGGMGQRLVIYGNNFGNDPSIVRVFIGGVEAKVIGVNANGIYCLVPSKAYEGQ